MNKNENKQFIHTLWDESIIPALKDYIQIPNKSPHFDRIGRKRLHGSSS